MNKTNVLKLADRIESGKYPFEMGFYSCCFMGNVCDLFGGRKWISEVFEITSGQAVELSSPEHTFADWRAECSSDGYISRSRAVRQLRRLAETEKVDWEAVK